MTGKVKKTRVNITMSDEMMKAYQEIADEMGVPRSNAIMMALKIYLDQQAVVKLQKQHELSMKAQEL